MRNTANAHYWTTFGDVRYTYHVEIENTSDGHLYIYSIVFGYRYLEPLDANRDNQTFTGTVSVAHPPKWSPNVPATYDGNASWGTTWRGTPESSGYILPGKSLAGFQFSSLTRPPDEAPFGVGFYNSREQSWGSNANGVAQHRGRFA